MSDYLNSLVKRTLGLAPVVQPRPASLFEPVASAGPASEAASTVSENVATQELALPSERLVREPFETSAQKTGRAFEDASPHTILQTQLPPATWLPTQVKPASMLLEGDRERKRDVRDAEPSLRSFDTEYKTSASEVPDNATQRLVKPEVRIFSPVTDREAVQPSLTTPPLAAVPANATRAESLSRTRELSAQAGDLAETPETVVVTIGRVDVRAIFAPPQAAPRAARTQPQPLSLDEYLKQRNEGRR